MNGERLPYWQVNVPIPQREQVCPDFLADANEKDRGILSTRDEDYHYQEWSEVQHFIKTNHIELFQRLPSDLRRYKEYTSKIKREYGSVMNFVLKERLRWTDLTPSGPPFTNPDDYKILYNDWPYGVDPKIIHLVIWTKFDLEDDPETDDLTPKARQEIDEFVRETFCSRVPSERVIWFKNWRSLKSVHAVEHFHVMLCDPDPRFVEEITGGDVPLAEKVKVNGIN
ncbi:MAG: hypothetical protein M1820_004380 [Bogoriella megaspora]|nr:MAG: hypothetical protein M1820_004380 [Bogoriella megaspora]